MYCQLELGFMEIAAVYCSEEMLGLFSSCSSSSNLAQCLGIWGKNCIFRYNEFDDYILWVGFFIRLVFVNHRYLKGSDGGEIIPGI